MDDNILVEAARIPDRDRLLRELREAGLDAHPVDEVGIEVPVTGSSDHLADELPTGVAMRWQGAGHGAIARSTCVTDAISRFLVQGVVPTEGMACPE